MEKVVEIKMQLPFSIRKQGKYYLSSCPILDVHSQATTEKMAQKNLVEAVSLFLISCFERGTLDSVLKECGFRTAPVYLRGKPRKVTDKGYIDVPIPFTISQPGPKECHA